jgi:hypothetical protein
VGEWQHTLKITNVIQLITPNVRVVKPMQSFEPYNTALSLIFAEPSTNPKQSQRYSTLVVGAGLTTALV